MRTCDVGGKLVGPGGEGTGTRALRLEPRKPDPDYEYLVLAFDPASYQIRGLMTRDRQGGESTIVFSNIRQNTNIPDKTFAPPRG